MTAIISPKNWRRAPVLLYNYMILMNKIITYSRPTPSNGNPEIGLQHG